MKENIEELAGLDFKSMLRLVFLSFIVIIVFFKHPTLKDNADNTNLSAFAKWVC
jgi:hypothetical protein